MRQATVCAYTQRVEACPPPQRVPTFPALLLRTSLAATGFQARTAARKRSQQRADCARTWPKREVFILVVQFLVPYVHATHEPCQRCVQHRTHGTSNRDVPSADQRTWHERFVRVASAVGAVLARAFRRCGMGNFNAWSHRCPGTPPPAQCGRKQNPCGDVEFCSKSHEVSTQP